MGIDLQAFLRATAASRFAWGQDDCCLFLAGWWHANHGEDPAAWLRGTYSDRAGCRATVTAHRGLQRLVTLVACQAGAQRTCNPKAGDFGLIAIGTDPYGAICAGSMWAIRSETGVGFVTTPRILRAWSIHELGQDLVSAQAGR